jgi:hypothetical protein
MFGARKTHPQGYSINILIEKLSGEIHWQELLQIYAVK